MKVIKKAGNILAILSILFVIYTLFRMDIDINLIDNVPGIVIVVLIGVAISGGTVYMLGLAWAGEVNYFAEKMIYPNLSTLKREVNVYARANLGKYMPGNVMHYVERNVFLGGSAHNQLEAIFSSVMEIAGQLCAALLIAIGLSYESLVLIFRQLVPSWILVLGGVFLLIIGMIVCVLYQKNKVVREIISKIFNFLFLKLFLFNLLIYILTIFLQGSIMVLLCMALKSSILLWPECRIILIAYTISWVAGFVVPGAPGGIGVREFVISIITKGSHLSDIILIAAVIQRVVTIGGDICCYVLELRRKGNK